MIGHSAAVGGTYLVKVSAANHTLGEYVLHVAGQTAAAPALVVAATDPADGAELTLAPATMDVTFSRGVLLPTLQAGDLTVGGLPATGFTVLDGDTVRFDLPALAEGVHGVAIAAGTIESVAGGPVGTYAGRLSVRTYEYPTPLTALRPYGGLVHAGKPVTASIPSPGDISSHTIDLEAGQILSATVTPSGRPASRS